jgi:hypothetical protein
VRGVKFSKVEEGQSFRFQESFYGEIVKIKPLVFKFKGGKKRFNAVSEKGYILMVPPTRIVRVE